MKPNLVISPHLDDEVLGCGGLLDSSFHVYFCGIDEGALREDKDPTPTPLRAQELEKVADYLGFEYEVNAVARVNHFLEVDFINLFEDLINRVRPDKIYLPHPGYNQDHRAVYHAAMIALRPHDRNFFVEKVLVYEAVHDSIWTPYKKMELNHFVQIDLERKLKAYAFYESQLRGMRSAEVITNLAAVRGAAANCDYAEAFEILRWCERRP